MAIEQNHSNKTTSNELAFISLKAYCANATRSVIEKGLLAIYVIGVGLAQACELKRKSDILFKVEIIYLVVRY